jgi:hypothetical protein
MTYEQVAVMRRRMPAIRNFALALGLALAGPVFAQGSHTYTFASVLANQWIYAPVTLSKGEQVKIYAGGYAAWGLYDTRVTIVTPKGHVGQYGSDFTAPDCYEFSLIARIGDDGTPFCVYDTLAFKATSDGPLELTMNDDNYIDNRGAWSAWIITP